MQIQKLKFQLMEKELLKGNTPKMVESRTDGQEESQKVVTVLTRKDVCRILGISLRTEQNLRDQRRISFSQSSRKVFYQDCDINDFLERHHIKANCGKRGGIDNNVKKVAVNSDEQANDSEIIQEKFWTYESGNATLDVEELYDYLFKKGYRYFLLMSKNLKFVVTVTNNQVKVFLQSKLWKMCCQIIDKDFLSIAEDERTKVKAALNESKKALKMKRLVQLKPENLESIEESVSKTFLINLNNKYNKEEGGKE
jgi:hypothetical protein